MALPARNGVAGAFWSPRKNAATSFKPAHLEGKDDRRVREEVGSICIYCHSSALIPSPASCRKRISLSFAVAVVAYLAFVSAAAKEPEEPAHLVLCRQFPVSRALQFNLFHFLEPAPSKPPAQPSPIMSSRQTKKAALAALRQRRSGLAATSSKLEEYEVADEGDVYDVVDEAEYEELVEKRRQREDFVVDDGTYVWLGVFVVVVESATCMLFLFFVCPY